MGKISITATDCITPVDNHYAFMGTLTITAANGDKIIGDYSGSSCSDGYATDIFPFRCNVSDHRRNGAILQCERERGFKRAENIQTGKGKIEADGTISY